MNGRVVGKHFEATNSIGRKTIVNVLPSVIFLSTFRESFSLEM
jgi:hypothetical protein